MGPESFVTWARAWEAAMAEAGYPNARLEPTIEFNGEITYHWNSDVDAMLLAILAGEEQDAPQDSWMTAHLAFILVDQLRPAYVSRSIALDELITKAQETWPPRITE